MKLLLALAAAGPLFAQQCNYTVNPTQFNIAANAGSQVGETITVTAAAGCPWAATTNISWLHIDGGQTGSGNGTVAWHADTNTVAAARSGTIQVAAQEVTVTQAAQVCTYTLSPPAGPDFPASGGGPSTIQVQTSCTWQASPNQNWIQLAAGSTAAVTGNGSVTYSVSGNNCATGRSGSIGIGSSAYALTEDGDPASFTFSPTTEAFSAAANDDLIAITTGSGCTWSAYSDVSWLTITSAATGAGDGSFSIHAVANTSAARSGNLHINDGAAVLLLPVTQAAPLPPPVQVSSVANAADYASNAVSPGEIVSLFGSNLGPAAAVGLQVAPGGGAITKSLGGVQVMFGSVAAALTYVSAGQVNAVVPYEVSGSSQISVQVINQGAASNTVTVPVVPATPAIFSLDGSGVGQGAILNQDLTVNGANNRAAPGSVVAIYATGGGVTNPASVDAAITGAPLPNLTLPYAATIGGLNAVVEYAGGAPGAVAGLTQLNVTVPPALTPGISVPVVITVGGVSSPAGITLAVQ